MTQPLTVKQLGTRTSMTVNTCSYILWELTTYGLVGCLNQDARRSRVYWLTELGKKCQEQLCHEQRLPQVTYNFPDVDWHLYGWVCFSHRSAVIKTLWQSLRPVSIKRLARSQNPHLRMSANNVRDIIRWCLAKGIVTKIYVKGMFHPCYELTSLGKDLQWLLLQAKVRA